MTENVSITASGAALPPCPTCGHAPSQRTLTCSRCGRPLVGPAARSIESTQSTRSPEVGAQVAQTPPSALTSPPTTAPRGAVPNPGQTVRRASLELLREQPVTTAQAKPQAVTPITHTPSRAVRPEPAQPLHPAQNLNRLEGEPVDLGRRFAAYLIDLMLSFVLMMALYAVITVLFMASLFSGSATVLNLLLMLNLLLYLGFSGGAALYHLRAVGTLGQTVGKAVMGMRVVDATTRRPIGVGRALGRGFYQFLMMIPVGLGFLTVLNDTSGWHRGWHDTMSGTIVVSAPQVPFGKALKEAWQVTLRRRRGSR